LCLANICLSCTQHTKCISSLTVAIVEAQCGKEFTVNPWPTWQIADKFILLLRVSKIDALSVSLSLFLSFHKYSWGRMYFKIRYKRSAYQSGFRRLSGWERRVRTNTESSLVLELCGRPAEAHVLRSLVLELCGRPAEAHVLRSLVLGLRGRPAEAHVLRSLVLELCGRPAEAHVLRSLVLGLCGRPAEAHVLRSSSSCCLSTGVCNKQQKRTIAFQIAAIIFVSCTLWLISLLHV
jgi:hypothetical protein